MGAVARGEQLVLVGVGLHRTGVPGEAITAEVVAGDGLAVAEAAWSCSVVDVPDYCTVKFTGLAQTLGQL